VTLIVAVLVIAVVELAFDEPLFVRIAVPATILVYLLTRHVQGIRELRRIRRGVLRDAAALHRERLP
jgi:hypothetical protein